MFKSKIKPTVVLVSICLVTALLLSGINMLTKDIIEQRLKDKENAAFADVYPNGTKESDVDLSKYTLPDVITDVYAMSDGGYIFKANVVGKSPDLIIMCGVGADGKIIGTKVISDGETPSYSAKVFPLVEGLNGQYKGMDEKTFEPVLVGNATLTSEAYAEAVKASLQSFVILKGGSVDLRDPAEILNDNCNEALGTEGLAFSKWFEADPIVGVDAIYFTKDNGGAVIKIGELFIGIDEDGELTNGEHADKAESAKAAFNVYKNSTLTEVTLPEGAKTSVKKIYVTPSGNYVFELSADGYSMHLAEKYPNVEGKPIEIKLSLTSDGKIISTLTVSHAESKGYGEKCADESYYSQYDGKTEANYSSVEDISKATITSVGYKKAIKDAFATFKLLKGEAE